MTRHTFFHALLSATLIFSLSSLCSCTRGYDSFSGYAQGGTWTVKANLKGVKTGHKQIQQTIETILDEIDNSVSGYNKNSILSHFNAGDSIVPDKHFTALDSLSSIYNEATDGAFDTKAGPIFDIWGFGFTTDSLPPADMVAEAMERSKTGKVINYNAIAQGYSCDVIADYLHSIGVHDMLVFIGEIYCEGLNSNGKGWTIGIDKPVDGSNELGAELQGIWESDGRAFGVVTSGNYRKFYIKDGRKYAHTIDPRTGYPVQHDLLSATILAPSSAEADALATACMVMGTESARDYILGHDGIEGYLITSDGVWNSPGFKLK